MNEITLGMGTKVTIIRSQFTGSKAEIICHIKDEKKNKKKIIYDYILAPTDQGGKDWGFCISMSQDDFEVIVDLKSKEKNSIIEHDLITHARNYGNDSTDVSTYVSTDTVVLSENTNSSSDQIKSNGDIKFRSNININDSEIHSNNLSAISGKIQMNNVSIEKIKFEKYLSLREREMLLVGKKVRVTNEESKYKTRYGTIESVIDENSYLISVAIVPSGGIYIYRHIYIFMCVYIYVYPYFHVFNVEFHFHVISIMINI
jgi:hypothetical protein